MYALARFDYSLIIEDNPPHLPDLDTYQGIHETFAVINIIEMSDILHPRTYQKFSLPFEERMEVIAARKWACTLTDWILTTCRLDSEEMTLREHF